MDKFGDMDLFVRVVKAGGLAVAGREIGLSPASVSARINGLEKRYQTRLLNRTTRSVSLTEAGKSFYDASICILADVAEAEGHLLSNRRQLSGPLRITAPADLGQQHIAPLVSKLVRKHPDITPHLHLSDGVINLTEFNIDVAIRYGEPPDSTLVARRLTDNHRLLCASPAYLKKNGTPNTPDDLVNHECLVMVRVMEPLTTWYFSMNESLQAISINPTCSSNDGALIRQWAVDGHGIAMKSHIDVANDIDANRLVQVLGNYSLDFQRSGSGGGADLYVAYPTRQYVPVRVRVFIDLLAQHFERHS